jgi:hypothetical protein
MRFRQTYTSYWLLHLRVLDPENEGTTHLQNTANFMLNKTASHASRLEPAAHHCEKLKSPVIQFLELDQRC